MKSRFAGHRLIKTTQELRDWSFRSNAIAC